MAKAILEFDLDNHDDVVHHLRCLKSTDMALALFEISRNLKKKCEHKCENIDGDPVDGMLVVLEEIHEILEDRGIDIDELI
jgi:hypothetical protein